MNQALNNPIVLITGATSGIGRVAAFHLAEKGATVIATSRNDEKGKKLLLDFKNHHPQAKGKIEIIHCDLSSFQSVVDAVNHFKRKYSRIDLLINNAGIFNARLKLSNDGIEETLQVNLLSPLLITLLLEEMIIASGGRIINTSSSFHHGTINFNDIEGRKRFSGLNAYRQSKLSEILISTIISNRLNGSGAMIFCQHPGVVRTNLGKTNGSFFNWGLQLIGKSPEKGAETMLYLASAPSGELLSGGFYANKKRWKTKPQSNNKMLSEKIYKVALTYIDPYIDKNLFFN